MLQVLNRDGGPFDAADLEMLEGIAIEISHVVENARLSQELIDRNRELERARRRAEERGAELDLLYDLERAIAAAVDVPELLRTVLARMCQRLGAIAASAVVAEAESEPQLFHAPAGAAETDPAALLRLASESPEAPPLEQTRVDQPARLGASLSWDGRAIGALQVSFERGADPIEHDEALRMVTLVAGQLARGIVLARERQARVQTERLALVAGNKRRQLRLAPPVEGRHVRSDRRRLGPDGAGDAGRRPAPRRRRGRSAGAGGGDARRDRDGEDDREADAQDGAWRRGPPR